MKLPRITGKEMCRIVHKLGFIQKRQRGSHSFWSHPDGRATVIPIHPGKNLPRGTIRRILRDVEISTIDYIRYRR